MTDLLRPQRIEVRCEGPLVVLAVGSTELKMEHELAIQLSTWLRVRGKEAKRIAGDSSRHWTVIGNLDAVLGGDKPW